MYSSYLTRETFENEHDEKMTRKFSYNYQVLKRLFPEVYKLPESEIRSLVHSIYDNPKMGDELLDHLSDVINKKKTEWGEYLNPKPEEPEQTVQNNPLQPVQPKPLNTSLGFEPYKPQKSAFGLGNTGGFGNAGGLGNSSAFGLNNTNNFGTIGGLKQSQLPDLTKGMDLKHSDMVTGFGINEAKQKSMLGTGFSMPKLPKMPQFPKAPEPQTPELPQMQPMNNFQKLQAEQIAANIRPKNINISDEDKILAQSNLARQVAFIYQGMANSLLNPIKYVAQDNQIDIMPLQAQNAQERIIEASSGVLNDILPFIIGGEAMAGTNFINRAALSSHFIPRTVAKSIQSFANPAAPSYELAGGIGGAILPAWVNLDIPDEKSSLIDNFKYYGGNTLLSVFGGLAGGYANALYNKSSLYDLAINMLRNINDASKIKQSYNILKQNPLLGNGYDIVTKMNINNKPPVYLHRGEAMIDNNGKIVVSGADLLRAYGTKRNFGLNKLIYKHEISRDEAMMIPSILRKFNPIEVTGFGQQIYEFKNQAGNLMRLVLSPKDDGYMIVSMYKID